MKIKSKEYLRWLIEIKCETAMKELMSDLSFLKKCKILMIYKCLIFKIMFFIKKILRNTYDVYNFVFTLNKPIYVFFSKSEKNLFEYLLTSALQKGFAYNIGDNNGRSTDIEISKIDFSKKKHVLGFNIYARFIETDIETNEPIITSSYEIKFILHKIPNDNRYELAVCNSIKYN